MLAITRPQMLSTPYPQYETLPIGANTHVRDMHLQSIYLYMYICIYIFQSGHISWFRVGWARLNLDPKTFQDVERV